MDIDNIYINYSHRYDEDLHIVEGSGTVESFLEDGADDLTKIGYIRFHYYNIYEFNNDQSLLLSADSISGDEIFMVHTLLENEFEFTHGKKLITLDRIDIKEKFYSMDLEEMILKEFLDYLSYMTFDYVAVIAVKAPKLDEDKQKIIDFPQFKMYEKFNFEIVNNDHKRMPVMVKNLNLL